MMNETTVTRRRIITVTITIACILILFACILITNSNNVTHLISSAYAGSFSSTLGNTPIFNAKNLNILYSENNNQQFSILSLDTQTSTSVLSDPLYSTFYEWNWSDKTQTLVGTGKDGLYTFSTGDPQPKLLVSADSLNSNYLDSPNWSPDGKTIVFVANQGSEPTISTLLMVYSLDGHKQTLLDSGQLTGNPAITTPRWSPDGQYIAFSEARPFRSPIISIMNTACVANPASKCDVRDFFGGDWSDPVWAPNGKKLAFQCDAACTMNQDGTGVRQLASGCAADPKWSPDGRYLACLDDTRNVIEFFDLDTMQDVFLFPIYTGGDKAHIFDWISPQEATFLGNIPTPVPSPTPAQALQIKASCSRLGLLSWDVYNYNNQDVQFTVEEYNKKTYTVQYRYNGLVVAASGNKPGISPLATQIKSGTTTLRIYVNGVLVATSDADFTLCATATPRFTKTATPTNAS